MADLLDKTAVIAALRGLEDGCGMVCLLTEDVVRAVEALPAVQVVAGQLGWTPLQNGAFADAFGLAGFYRIVGIPGFWELHRPRGVAMHVDDGFDTQAAAKAAAQADYDARIRSALVVHPAPRPQRVAMTPEQLAEGFATSGAEARWIADSDTGVYDAADECGFCGGSGIAVQPAPVMTVWYGSMPESNGKQNWTASLHRKGSDPHLHGFCFARSEYAGRVRYEADRMRWIIGELADKPNILAYDDKLHSGYVEPAKPAPDVAGLEADVHALRERMADLLHAVMWTYDRITVERITLTELAATAHELEQVMLRKPSHAATYDPPDFMTSPARKVLSRAALAKLEGQQ